MRLIDIDKVVSDYKGKNKSLQNVTWFELTDYEVKAIPIDKPFLKMRYGDYVVYNKKWLVNHLQTEWNILQGKEYQPSIPIEWIKEHYGWLTMAGEIIKDWEKENEQRENSSPEL